jgi:hypothetical protein
MSPVPRGRVPAGRMAFFCKPWGGVRKHQTAPLRATFSRSAVRRPITREGLLPPRSTAIHFEPLFRLGTRRQQAGVLNSTSSRHGHLRLQAVAPSPRLSRRALPIPAADDSSTGVVKTRRGPPLAADDSSSGYPHSGWIVKTRRGPQPKTAKRTPLFEAKFGAGPLKWHV